MEFHLYQFLGCPTPVLQFCNIHVIIQCIFNEITQQIQERFDLKNLIIFSVSVKHFRTSPYTLIILLYDYLQNHKDPLFDQRKIKRLKQEFIKYLFEKEKICYAKKNKAIFNGSDKIQANRSRKFDKQTSREITISYKYYTEQCISLSLNGLSD